jgi:hypothetical protein
LIENGAGLNANAGSLPGPGGILNAKVRKNNLRRRRANIDADADHVAG